MKNKEAQEVIEKAKDKELEKVENAIGIKGRRFKKMIDLDRNASAIAIKCYDEQMPKGWAYVKEKLRDLDRHKYQVVAIRHDKDTVEGSSFFKPSLEKPHYHILIRLINPNGTVNRNGQHVRSFLKGTGIVFRPKDETMISNHGIEIVGDWCAYVLYLTHETEKARGDGKEIYKVEDLVSNCTLDEIMQFREGYSRVSEEKRKLSQTDMAEIAKTVYELGKQLKDYEDWNDAQPFSIQSHSKQKDWRKRYERGVQHYMKENGTDIVRLCIYIKGTHNVGKTRTSKYALEDMGYTEIVKVGGQGTGKYDDIKCTTEAVIIDDDTTPNALNMTEDEIGKAYHRGAGNSYWTGKIVIVTSNLDFNEYAKRCGVKTEEEIKALRSRFYVCETVKAGSRTRLKNVSAGKRGDEADQLERKELYLKFRDAFHKRIDEYVKSESINYDDLNDFELREVLTSRLEEIVRTRKKRAENLYKSIYECGCMNSGQYNEQLKKNEEFATLLREKYYDILLEKQNEKCIGYPAVDYTEDAKRVNVNKDEPKFSWN